MLVLRAEILYQSCNCSSDGLDILKCHQSLFCKCLTTLIFNLYSVCLLHSLSHTCTCSHSGPGTHMLPRGEVAGRALWSPRKAGGITRPALGVVWVSDSEQTSSLKHAGSCLLGSSASGLLAGCCPVSRLQQLNSLWRPSGSLDTKGTRDRVACSGKRFQPKFSPLSSTGFAKQTKGLQNKD